MLLKAYDIDTSKPISNIIKSNRNSELSFEQKDLPNESYQNSLALENEDIFTSLLNKSIKIKEDDSIDLDFSRKKYLASNERYMSPIKGTYAENGFLNSIDNYSMRDLQQNDLSNSNSDMYDTGAQNQLLTRIKYRKKNFKQNNSITYETIENKNNSEYLNEIQNHNNSLLRKLDPIDTNKIIFKFLWLDCRTRGDTGVTFFL